MEISRPVFVLVTAGNCGHCAHFSKQWPSIRRAIESWGAVEIVEIPLPTTASTLDTRRYPADLQRYIRWFPSMFLFSETSWNAAMHGTGRLEGLVMNGILDPEGNVVPQHGPSSTRLDEAGIVDWMRRNVGSLRKSPAESHGLFTKRKRTSSLHPLKKETCSKLNLRPKNRF